MTVFRALKFTEPAGLLNLSVRAVDNARSKVSQGGDRIRFTAIPDEWSMEGYSITPQSVWFMKAMFGRTWQSRIAEIDEYGSRWIHVRAWIREKLESHS